MVDDKSDASSRTTSRGGQGGESTHDRAEEMRRNKERVVLETLRAKVGSVDLRAKAEALGGRYDETAGRLHLHLLDQTVSVDEELRVHTDAGPAGFEDTAMVLNSLLRPGGLPRDGWKTFREFAGGHASDFHQGTELPLAERASELVERSEQIASAVGGRLADPLAGSDVTFVIPIFPRVEALVQVFGEDMEFPAEVRILFSEGADRFLPPGVLEELGHRLGRRMLEAAVR